ncbi:FGGY-family carbohydrate kinase [Pseudaestuariivita sp.]|uniref:FGGY-family carbohydrate kinase n=1 Tax=Pseudaestuariivita sp. TaxID=2211669 RepID=UPI0040581BDA
MSLALGIDIGTSGVRTAVLDARGDVLSMARAPHLPQDPDRIDATLWWGAVKACLAAQQGALAEHGHAFADVTCIAIDGTSGSMVLTDAALQPVTRALMYNSKGFDAEAAQIARHAPTAHITQGSNSALGRAMRLVSEDTSGTARHLLHQADYIAACLTGQGGLSDHNNALKTGFDPETEAWPDWIGEVIDPALLPAALPVGAPIGQVAPSIADQLGLDPNATVQAGTTDSIAAFIAAAPVRAGVAVTSLGSTLAIKLLSPVRIDDPAIGLYAHRLGDVWLVGGASNTGGAVLADFFDSETLAQLSAQIDPNTPSGLDYYPLRAPGERFPVNDPAHPPRMTPRPESDARFLQGLYEGIARIEAQCFREIAARGGAYPSLVLSAGGGASDATFTAIRAKALGVTPQTPPHTEAAIGSAKIAAGLVG